MNCFDHTPIEQEKQPRALIFLENSSLLDKVYNIFASIRVSNAARVEQKPARKLLGSQNRVDQILKL